LKLSVGDYTTDELIGKAHVERKSPNDLYGSLIQNHERFRAELIRARTSGIRLAVFVECPDEIFYMKKFRGGYKLKTAPRILRQIVSTMADKYDVDFIFCKDRNDMRCNIMLWFERQKQLVGKNA